MHIKASNVCFENQSKRVDDFQQSNQLAKANQKSILPPPRTKAFPNIFEQNRFLELTVVHQTLTSVRKLAASSLLGI